MLAINIPSHVFEEEGIKIEAAFLDACEWLKSLGVFHRSNRFSTYVTLFEDFRAGRGELMQTEDGLRRFVNALAEASELIRIRKGMQEIDSSSYMEQLKKVTSGQAFKTAVGSDPARDFSFELSVASRFLAAGYPVDVSNLADIIVRVDGNRIFVECKRVQSASKVMSRLSEARDQIAIRLNADHSPKSRGLVACRITEVLNPRLHYALFPSPLHFRGASEEALQGYVSQHKPQLEAKIAKKQLGILFENSLHGVVYNQDDPKSVPAFINCRGAALYYRGLGSQDEQLISSLAPTLANQHVL